MGLQTVKVPFRDLSPALLQLGLDFCEGKLDLETYQDSYASYLAACGWTLAEYMQVLDATWDLTFTERQNPKG